MFGDAGSGLDEHELDELYTGGTKYLREKFPDLRPVEKAPSLTTINSCGFKIYGRSDYDEETDSYMTTQFFVLLFIPFFPVARYRVRMVPREKYKLLGMTMEKGNQSYQFLGKGAMRPLEKVWLVLMGLFFLMLVSLSFVRSH